MASSSIITKRCGIHNPSNYCFMNSAIQCLASTPFIIEFLQHYLKQDVTITAVLRKFDLMDDEHIVDVRNHIDKLLADETLTKTTEDIEILKYIQAKYDCLYLYTAVKDLIKCLIFRSNKTLSPEYVIDIGKICTRDKGFEYLFQGDQNDPHEFLAFILDMLHKAKSKHVKIKIPQFKPTHTIINQQYYEHFKKRYEKDHSYFVDNFYYYLLNCVQCNKCEAKSWEMSPSDILCLPMPADILHKSDATIYDCFKQLFQPERIDYKCEKCGNTENNTIEKKILTRPKTLILKLKRYTSVGSNLVKVSKFIEYPETINLAEYSGISKNSNYKLCGVINHIGILNSGHYYSYVKEIVVEDDKIKYKNKWWECNDTNVREISLDSVMKSQNAYMLFYYVDDGTYGDAVDDSMEDCEETIDDGEEDDAEIEESKKETNELC